MSQRELDDPKLTGLVGELSLKSPEFRKLWARHDVTSRTSGVKRFANPLVGPLALSYATFDVNGTDRQTLFIFFAPAASPDQDSLALLARIAADQASDVKPTKKLEDDRRK